MSSRRLRRLILLAALAAVVVACGESSEPTPEPSEFSLFFPQRPPPTGPRVGQAALLQGRLVVEDGCVWLAGRAGRHLIVWPSSYLPARVHGSLAILGPERTIIALQGQDLALAGGEVAIDQNEARNAVRELAGAEIPFECKVEQVWNASAIMQT